MKQHLKSTSLLVKMLGIIGGGFLCITILQCIMLPRNILANAETTTDSLFSYYATIFFFNSVLFLVITLLIRHVYMRYIQNPLHDLSRLIQSPAMLSDIDVADSSMDSSCREIQDFSAKVFDMLYVLQKLFEQIAQTTEPLVEASQALVSSSQAQSSRIAFQRPSHEEMMSSIQELGGMVKKNSHDIHAVVDVAHDTLRVAEHGQQAVMNVRMNMEDIQRSSRISSEKIVALEKQTEHINDVMATIDRIIEDTKLIAFNATIEAARAKDDGKGFGVVALEIKRLAEEVFESTGDIKELIKEIQHASHALVLSAESELKSIQRGGALAEEAGVSLQHIVDMVKCTTESTQKIATATEQQHGTSEHMQHLADAANRSADQLARDIHTFSSTAERIQQQIEALVEILDQPFAASNRQHRIFTTDL